MLLGVIADDFTGASDIANTLAKGLGGDGGLRTSQYLGVPAFAAAPEIEAGVVALKTRSVPLDAAVDQSLRALAWLQAQGCRQFVFKYCSTFDSTPAGNIGPVGEALADALGAMGVVACPAFPTLGRTVYQGHLFVNDRPLNESGMEKHPLTPMTDSDIRRWLARQCRTPVGLVSRSTVARGAQALREACETAARRGETLAIVDAIADDDLITIGEACRDATLITGGSGIALGLPRNFIQSGAARGGATSFNGVEGPEALLAGSCSRTTLKQIAVHAKAHPVLNLDIERVMRGDARAQDAVDFILSNSGREPLVYSSDTAEHVAAMQQRYGRARVASTLDGLFATIARTLVEHGITRLVVAGGETSGAVASALDLRELTIGPEIDPGVPVLFTRGPRRLALALKSGNFGSADFFTRALARLQRG
ncbi:MAG TPA: 3-oxo-tetronate kinase [Pseudolabrys sp.]|nr:3-oxo-tetronate kinase [Pseudolabrys sp.]